VDLLIADCTVDSLQGTPAIEIERVPVNENVKNDNPEE
jgi:hypothetical protein